MVFLFSSTAIGSSCIVGYIPVKSRTPTFHCLPFLAPRNHIFIPARRGFRMDSGIRSSSTVGECFLVLPEDDKKKSSANVTAGLTSEGLDISSAGLIGEKDLLVVGPGVLGRIIAEKWKSENPDCKIFGQTMTTYHHDELLKIGINPSLRGSKEGNKFPYVMFCAPPSRTEDYPSEVREHFGKKHIQKKLKSALKSIRENDRVEDPIMAVSSWNGEGSFLFTSSTAVYDCEDNGECSEDAPIFPIGKSPRADVLLKAENVALEVGGCVVRLAGLYKSGRGAHAYWLEKGTLDIRPDHILNLIHYEDAASLSIAILKKQLRSRVFLGCDNHPLSRQELMDLVNRSKKFNKTFQGFTGTTGVLGKRLNNSKTRAEIGWEPKYPSFENFLGLS